MRPEDVEVLLAAGLRDAARDADPVRSEEAYAYWSGRAAEAAEVAGDERGAESAREHQRAARERLAVARAEVRTRHRRAARIIVARDLARRARPRARRDAATSKTSASSSGDDPPGGPALPVFPRRRTFPWSDLDAAPALRPPRQGSLFEGQDR